jgi:hypothetical protein
MDNLENATPFAARVMPSMDREGRDVLLVVVAAHFALPAVLEEHRRWQLFPTQESPPLADEYRGDPGQSSLLHEGQSSYTKPATDICVIGDACAPDGVPVTQMSVHVQVGPCVANLQVTGDRTWRASLSGRVTPSDPAPFLRMPMTWERAYGGAALSSTEQQPAFEPRNPVGCGFETSELEAVGRAVPNIEDPGELLTQVSDRPAPMGLAPVGRSWQPRVQYAGTYDDDWKRRRAPLWPDDFDERYFCCAPQHLQAFPHLSGGEYVHLMGLHPEGPLRFRLPAVRLALRTNFVNRVVRTRPVLDGVIIDTNIGQLTLHYRTAILAPLSLASHRETLLRLAAPWEADVLQ